MQFGKLNLTTVLSQQKGETSTIEVKGGAQLSNFEVYADNYEANRHFFLSQHFRDTYDDALKNLPIVSTGVNIPRRIEVWITNKTSRFEETRNIIAFQTWQKTAVIFLTKYLPFNHLPEQSES